MNMTNKNTQAASPKVSVIVTIFDSGDFLETCLRSLAKQTLVDIQVICVDDCSPDYRDAEIAERFCAENNNFIYVRNSTNSGTGLSRERGVKIATGEYVGFLDSDDFCEPYTYEMLYDIARRDAADIVVGDYILSPPNAVDRFASRKPESVRVAEFTGISFFSQQINRIINPFYVRVDWWNKIYRRSMLIENNYSFPHVTRNEGSASMIVSLLAEKVSVVDWQMFFTTARPNSVSRSFKVKNIDDIIASTLFFREWLLKLGAYRQFAGVFESFFGHIVLNHNLTLISQQDDEDRIHFYQAWRDRVLAAPNILALLFRYCNGDERVTERIALRAILQGNYNNEIIAKVRDSKPNKRIETGTRVKRGSRVRSPSGTLVTVATIVRNLVSGNRTEFFDRMVHSIDQQNYGRENIEHIIIDGASTDDTLNFLRKYEKDNKIDYLISERDTGIYNAMNKAIRYSKGDIVVFMNSDDFFMPGAIKVAVNAMERDRADVCFGNAIKVDESEKRVGSHVGDLRKVFFGSPYCHQTVYARRQCLVETPFPEEFRLTMWAHALSLYMKGYKHIHVNKNLAAFRVGGASTQTELGTFIDEQTTIKEVVADFVGLTPNEFELINRTIRRQKMNESVDKDIVAKKLANQDSELGRDFLEKTLGLILSLPELQRAS